MYPFFETIKLARGKVFNLDYHQERVNRAFKVFYQKEPLELSWILETNWVNIPLDEGPYRCRIAFNEITYQLECLTYSPRKIESLQIIEYGNQPYQHKFTDRTYLDRLFDKKGNADDILFISEKRILDCSYANVALWDGTDWFTPTTYLLRGTKREELLSKGRIKEKRICVDDLIRFQSLSLINAMLELGQITIAIDQIFK